MKALISLLVCLGLLIGGISNSFAEADKSIDRDIGIETHHHAIDQASFAGDDGFCFLPETSFTQSSQWQEYTADTAPSYLTHHFATNLIRAPPFSSLISA